MQSIQVVMLLIANKYIIQYAMSHEWKINHIWDSEIEILREAIVYSILIIVLTIWYEIFNYI